MELELRVKKLEKELKELKDNLVPISEYFRRELALQEEWQNLMTYDGTEQKARREEDAG